MLGAIGRDASADDLAVAVHRDRLAGGAAERAEIDQPARPGERVLGARGRRAVADDLAGVVLSGSASDGYRHTGADALGQPSARAVGNAYAAV